MDSLFQTLSEANRIALSLKDHQGRLYGTQLGICTHRWDGDEYARIKATIAPYGAKHETDWLYRLSPSKGISTVVPSPGDTVLVLFDNGDSHKGYYLGVLTNAVNPGLDPDSLSLVNGNSSFILSPDSISMTVGNMSLEVTNNGVTINGKDVATLGAKDTADDLLITRGY